MEMLVVVAIIVALAGIGGYYYFAQLDKANEGKCKAQVQLLTKAAETYQINNTGVFPESLTQLLEADPNNTNKPYLDNREAIIDPWGREYRYQYPGQNNGNLKPDIWSDTPNGPVGNWSTRTR